MMPCRTVAPASRRLSLPHGCPCLTVAPISLRQLSQRVVMGLQSMETIVKKHNIHGVHGCVIDLLHFKPELDVAIEESAKSNLFRVVVETDKVASEILGHMRREKLQGHLEFLPLNRLKVERRPPVPVGPRSSGGVAVALFLSSLFFFFSPALPVLSRRFVSRATPLLSDGQQRGRAGRLCHVRAGL